MLAFGIPLPHPHLRPLTVLRHHGGTDGRERKLLWPSPLRRACSAARGGRTG
jgi:hypothetical protein